MVPVRKGDTDMKWTITTAVILTKDQDSAISHTEYSGSKEDIEQIIKDQIKEALYELPEEIGSEDFFYLGNDEIRLTMILKDRFSGRFDRYMNPIRQDVVIIASAIPNWRVQEVQI